MSWVYWEEHFTSAGLDAEAAEDTDGGAERGAFRDVNGDGIVGVGLLKLLSFRGSEGIGGPLQDGR
jgi:hypothetical protein